MIYQKRLGSAKAFGSRIKELAWRPEATVRYLKGNIASVLMRDAKARGRGKRADEA